MPTSSTAPALAPHSTALKKYWGYDTFRPKQEEVVLHLCAGRDVCVVMPTGAGKSLCYQLPAALQHGKTAVVISPLIALMQDQVAQLRQMGIPAAFLNSAVEAQERSEVRRRIAAGEFRLLYLSPEMAVMDGTGKWLKTLPVSFFAIDEAHCISQWGHDFRPEYRQLNKLRAMFPNSPIAAFTASATQRVRHDIVQQLQLNDPFKSVSSFRRENLNYSVKEAGTREQEELLLEVVKRVKDGTTIVYSPTVARVGELVDLLADNGVAAIGYHGQMDAATRRQNQEKWMNEEVRVLVGTVAFGLGINNPNVRAVVRLGLPDSIEHFYQQAGRAGRDGLPANCYLFWQKKDYGLHAFFIEKISDSTEKNRAWDRYHEMKSFVSSQECRHRQICEHFGEPWTGKSCGVCDVCAGIPDWLAVTTAAQPGAKRGKRNRRFERNPDRAIESMIFEATADDSANDELREFLREWRKSTARENAMPAFVVMHDTTLENLCRIRPKTLAELRGVSGMGEKKCEAFGNEILDAMKRFESGQRASQEWHTRPSSPAAETLDLLKQGHSLEQIAQLRGRKLGTVVSLVADLVEKDQVPFQVSWVAPEKFARIREVAIRLGSDWKKPIKEALPEEFTFEEITLVLAEIRRGTRKIRN
jgi:ATP-dependent DNA helicase RecQ